MNKSSDVTKDILIKIAYWYYKRNMTQAEIAKRLGFTRQRVNKLINSLIDCGIVEIQINGLTNDFTDLEYKIEEKFNLQRVCVFNKDDFYVKAATVLDSLFENDQIIGLSWGKTLGETVSTIHSHKLKNSTIVQLAGGMNSLSTIVRPDEITRSLAHKLNCSFHLLYAPAFVNSIELKNAMLNEAGVKTTFNIMEKCDVAILGVGNLKSHSTLGKEGFVPNEFLEDLVNMGCVGDMAMLPFKKDGTWHETDHIIGIGKETLKKIPNVVLLAKGKEKAESVIGAINTNCINTVVIDREIAKEIANEFNLL